jgi:hypothetical protein
VPGASRPFILKPFSLTALLTTIERVVLAAPVPPTAR